MSLVNVTDRGGHTLILAQHADGYRTCSFNHPAEETVARVQDMKKFECRSDDIFLITPVKSGTHWCWEIMSMLVQGKPESIPVSKVALMMEATPVEKTNAWPSPRILNTHVNVRYMPKQLTVLKCKIVFCVRNPKDVMVSLYNHVKGITIYDYDGKWEDFFSLFLEDQLEYGSWFDYILEWEQFMEEHTDLPIHCVYYEDLKENNLDEVARLGQFLGVENKDELYERVSEKCMFKNMRTDKEATMKFLRDDFSMYRKGEIGDWKNWFTVAQNELFDTVYAEKMSKSKLNFRYSYKK